MVEIVMVCFCQVTIYLICQCEVGGGFWAMDLCDISFDLDDLVGQEKMT